MLRFVDKGASDEILNAEESKSGDKENSLNLEVTNIINGDE